MAKKGIEKITHIDDLDDGLLRALENYINKDLRGDWMPQIAEAGELAVEQYAPELTGRLKRGISSTHTKDSITVSVVALDENGVDYSYVQEYGGASTNMPWITFEGRHYLEGGLTALALHVDDAVKRGAAFVGKKKKVPPFDTLFDYDFPETNPVTHVNIDNVSNNIDSEGNQVRRQRGAAGFENA